MKTLVIFSGGMDSATLLYHTLAAKRGEVETLTFDYGSKHNEIEYQHALKICSLIGVKNKRISLPFINELFSSNLLKSGSDIPDGHYEDPVMRKTVVPFRNGIMLSIACGYAESIGAEYVAIGNHSGDHAIYPDCRSSFTRAMGDAMFYGTYSKIELSNPFVGISKTQIVEIGEKLYVPWKLTYSCYKGRESHCGKCGTCVERKMAFTEAGIIDPTDYEK